jgi:hypothetical protein
MIKILTFSLKKSFKKLRKTINFENKLIQHNYTYKCRFFTIIHFLIFCQDPMFLYAPLAYPFPKNKTFMKYENPQLPGSLSCLAKTEDCISKCRIHLNR